MNCFVTGTSLRKNFRPIPKSKMAAAAAITAHYEIGHNLKSIQLRDLGKECNEAIIYILRANTPQSKMAVIWVKIGILRLSTYSRGVILQWVLQNDRSF